jgi:hypothetical protein
MSNPDKPAVSRRGLLMLAAVGGAAMAVVGLKLANRRGGATSSLATPLDSGGVNTLIAFLATLFAHEMSAEDVTELQERLTESQQQDPQRMQTYAVLSRHLDGFAHTRGAASFTAATAAQRNAILDEVMHIEPARFSARVLSHLSTRAHQYYQIRSLTIPSLAWLYRNSGVPWRARGYQRWPGIPGDWHEILVPGNVPA